MKLIVGLGNPGKEYELTRHNIGFMALDHFLGNVTFKKKNNALFYEKNINDEKVIFLKPITFMNDSGSAVKYFLNYFNISIEDLLVIYDDMDFDLGNFKLRKFGSSAGHNGIKSIIANLNTEDFKRIRIGISKSKFNSIDYVLGKFNKEEMLILNNLFNTIDNVIEDFLILDFDKLMNKYN